MKIVTLENNSIKLVRTVLRNEVHLLEFNLRNGVYFPDETEAVIEEIGTLNNIIEQLKQE